VEGNLFDRSIVAIGLAKGDEFDALFLDFVQVVRGISHDFGFDAKRVEIFEDRVLVLFAFLGGICIVEAENEFAFVVSCCGGIEDSCLGVTNVKVPGWLPCQIPKEGGRTSGGNRVTTLPISAPSSLNPISFGFAFYAISKSKAM
jgi:hypothetical protein